MTNLDNIDLLEEINDLTTLTKEIYYELLKKYSKTITDNYLNLKIEQELQESKTLQEKIKIWDKYGYYLSTKEHSVYEKIEIENLEQYNDENQNCLSPKEEIIYGLHLLGKNYLNIIEENQQVKKLNIPKVFSSIKTKETRDYILYKLNEFLTNTNINSKENQDILLFIEKYQKLCQKEEIPNLDNIFNKNEINIISELELIEQIDMYIRYKKAKEIYFNNNIELVKYSVRECYKEDEIYEESVQDGMIELDKAIETFDIRFKNKFSTYAVPVIKRAIIRKRVNHISEIHNSYYLNNKKRQISNALRILTNRLGRYPTTEELTNYLRISKKTLYSYLYKIHIFDAKTIDEVISKDDTEPYTLKETLPDKNSEFEEKIILSEVKKEILKKIKEILTEEEYYLILKKYGFYDDKELTLRELGKELNLTGEAIRKRELKILNKIKSNQKIKKLNPYI